MFNDIKAKKLKCNGYYTLSLEIPEKALYLAYDEIDEETILEVASSYCKAFEEEATPRDISITRLEDKDAYQVEMELIYPEENI